MQIDGRIESRYAQAFWQLDLTIERSEAYLNWRYADQERAYFTFASLRTRGELSVTRCFVLRRKRARIADLLALV